MRKDSQKSLTVTRRTRRDLAKRVATMRQNYVRIYNGGTVVPATSIVDVPDTVPTVDVAPVPDVEVPDVAPDTSHAVDVVPDGDKFRAVCSQCGPLGTKPTGESHAKAARTRHLTAVAA